MNIEIVHNFIIRMFGIYDVGFWISHDQSPAEILNRDSIEEAPALLSTINADAQFNTDVQETMEAVLENAEGPTINRKT